MEEPKSVPRSVEVAAPHLSSVEDSAGLARLGKKQVLKRRFGFLSMLGFTCTILTTWESVFAIFTESFTNGGPAGSIYGFLVAWLCSSSIYLVISECASMAPTAGGQYHWTSMLAPVSQRRFFSYITGWINSIGWIATVTTGIFINGTTVQGLVVLNRPEYTFERWHGTLLCWAAILIALGVNVLLPNAIPGLQTAVLVLHVVGFFAVLVPLVVLAPHATRGEVFGTWLNEGGWPTQGVSFCVGLVGNIASFAGADAAVHMAEEIEKPAVNVPRAIMLTMLLNGTLGFATMVGLVFCVGNFEAALTTPTGYPFIEVLVQGTKSVAGATVMTAVLTTIDLAASVGFMACASRMTWSFARDRGLPWSRYITYVDRRTAIPVVALGVISVIPALLVLINIGSTTVLNDVVSLSVTCIYASYLPPCALLLWRRTTGAITPYSCAVDSTVLQWGPFKVPGVLGVVNNVFAVAYIVFVIFWSFWPPITPTTPQNMNWSVLMTGAALLWSVGYFLLRGRKMYRGPVVEVDVRDVAEGRSQGAT